MPTLRLFLTTVVLTSTLITGCVGLGRSLGWLEVWELSSYDAFLQRRSPEPTDERIVIVGISEEDLQSRQEYPLEDGSLADLLEALEGYEPRAIGIDIGRDIPQGPSAGRRRLETIIANSDHIISVCLLSAKTHPGVPAAPGTPEGHIGYADFPQDRGGTIRRFSLVSTPDSSSVSLGKPHLCNNAQSDAEIPSFSLLLASFYLETEGLQLTTNDAGTIYFGKTPLPRIGASTGGYHQADTPEYQLLLNYRAHRNAVREVSMGDVLAQRVEPSWLKDRVVLIGYTSPVVGDMRLTPYPETRHGQREMPGVEIHAQALSQLLSTVLDDRPLLQTWSDATEVGWIWLWAIAGGTVALFCRPMWGFVLTTGGLMIGGWGVCIGLFSQGWWIPFVPSWMAFLGSAIAVRLLHGANQSGYAQAFYEDLMLAIRDRNRNQINTSEDYLNRLARRAELIRLGKSEEELLMERLTHSSQPGGVYHKARKQLIDELLPQLYAEVEQELRQKIEIEQRSKRLESLLKRAESLRHDLRS